MANYTTITSDKSKKKALILCIFGGVLGLHDYYLGNIVKGIIKSLTANFFLIGWVHDLIKISTGGYKDNTGAPLRK